MASIDEKTGVLVNTKIFPLAFLLLLFKTNITIDGVTKIVPWGSSFYKLHPGKHDVTVSFRYLLGREMGEARRPSTSAKVRPYP
jgi:hypothetical protein